MIPILDTLIGLFDKGLDKVVPDANVRLQQATELAKLAHREFELEIQDRASARAREMAVKDKTPAYLAYISIGGFFGVLAVQFYFAWTIHPIDTAVQRTLDISTGVLFAMVLAVKDYYFGSSKSSDDKTKLLMNSNGK